MGHKGPLSPPQLARAAPAAARELCVPVWARCCAWNTRPISSGTAAEQWGHSGQAQPLPACLYIQLLAMLALVAAEPLLPTSVSRTESLHGVSAHSWCFPRCLRMVLDISINYPRRISFFSWNDGLQLVKVQLAPFTPNLCWEDHPWVASRHYSSHAQVMLEPLDVTSEQSCILFLSVCECRRGAEPIRSLLFFFHMQNSRTEINLD